MKGKVPAGNIKLKRAYEAPAPDDGMRILVDKESDELATKQNCSCKIAAF